jgi:hypothetical protein
MQTHMTRLAKSHQILWIVIGLCLVAVMNHQSLRGTTDNASVSVATSDKGFESPVPSDCIGLERSTATPVGIIFSSCQFAVEDTPFFSVGSVPAIPHIGDSFTAARTVFVASMPDERRRALGTRSRLFRRPASSEHRIVRTRNISAGFGAYGSEFRGTEHPAALRAGLLFDGSVAVAMIRISGAASHSEMTGFAAIYSSLPNRVSEGFSASRADGGHWTATPTMRLIPLQGTLPQHLAGFRAKRSLLDLRWFPLNCSATLKAWDFRLATFPASMIGASNEFSSILPITGIAAEITLVNQARWLNDVSAARKALSNRHPNSIVTAQRTERKWV